ncbi:sulfotransferase 1A1-like isoform X2 [Liolophura sinensis]|uniref:sulfotransferase 1A1-like isoform X2 n=1 Tax=Liolophura sinensis TaxID=3198878 RepID=UPI0031587CC2
MQRFNMPTTEVRNSAGDSIQLHEYNGKYYPLLPHIEGTLPQLPDLPCRDDDVMILTYPKAGTHWTWEIVNMLYAGDGQISSRRKGESMMEAVTVESLAALPSVRLLNTHLPPEFYPKDLIKRKCKVIFVQRNPKDVYVSFFHHTKKFKPYDFKGDWNSYFLMAVEGKVDYGTWFDFTKQYEQFFSGHPDIPVLRLYFEDMKQDLPTEVEKICNFLGLSCEPSYRDKVVEKCGFQFMKNEKKIPESFMNTMVNGKEDPIFRKGIIGDWKSHFTVAQNERFDQEYKQQMKGFSFPFEQYM